MRSRPADNGPRGDIIKDVLTFAVLIAIVPGGIAMAAALAARRIWHAKTEQQNKN